MPIWQGQETIRYRSQNKSLKEQLVYISEFMGGIWNLTIPKNWKELINSFLLYYMYINKGMSPWRTPNPCARKIAIKNN